MDNGKKEFPRNGLEEDGISKWSRKYYCSLNNRTGITKGIKRTLNKRFRKRIKNKLNKL